MNVLLLSIFLTILTGAGSQNTNTFPTSWEGIWEGTMDLYREGIITGTVPVKLTIAKTANPITWTWKTEYLSPKQPVTKNYLLRTVDATKGIYVTDEGGGVELYNYLYGNKTYNVFETDGIMLTSTYEKIGNQLIFEVTSGKKISSGSPLVINYSVENLQRVIFKIVSKFS
eukprot:TRINITY_DN5196_c0_g1_i2.p1 TRINITY_DN5196_c0_g1~~TRINITY_DN5196_c0_g1_i2.p1  ORF type:complete len:171 (-),score=19.44 TRINITY_DN5196_c0_g1_i2:31-543(-)